MASGQSAAAVEWWDDGAEKLSGTLLRIDCLGREFRLEIRDEQGASQKLLIRDPGKIAVSGGEMTFVCGVQKARSLALGYKPVKDAARGTIGEILTIDLK